MTEMTEIITSSQIASHTVPGTDVTITITRRPHTSKPAVEWFTVTSESRTQGHYSCGRPTEALAREAANDFWRHAIVTRDARNARLQAADKAADKAAAEILANAPKEVPAGRYALRTDEGIVKFYKVDRPTEGHWAGYTFLSAQAGDELWPIKARDTRLSILRQISLDPRAASELYGRELGVCGVCGRTLTDEESRARGIGPVCAAKF